MLHTPNAKIAALLIDARVNALETQDGKRDAEQIKNILLKYNNKLSSYNCGCCNFKSKTFFWQCPACYSWESISPNNTES
jgi:lipopolysaccharide biosynthesis regulator YciM